MEVWMKNTDGKRDAVLTMAFIGFMTVITKVLLSDVDIMSFKFSLGPIDAATIGALLTPTLGAYVARRYTDRKFDTTDTTQQ